MQHREALYFFPRRNRAHDEAIWKELKDTLICKIGEYYLDSVRLVVVFADTRRFVYFVYTEAGVLKPILARAIWPGLAPGIVPQRLS